MAFNKNAGCYYVTLEGVNQFRRQFSKLAIYKKPNERDKNYLRHQINFYCQFRDYQLGDDPATWVFEDFEKYFWGGFYMSETMKDITNRFKPQLKKIFPKPKIK